MRRKESNQTKQIILTETASTQNLRSLYVFDVDFNLFTEDVRVACAAVSKSVSLKITAMMQRHFKRILITFCMCVGIYDENMHCVEHWDCRNPQLNI